MRKKREVNTTEKDILLIEDNIANTKYDDENKKLLKLQTQRLKEELEKQQISQIELSNKSGVSTGAISKYASGKALINVEYLPKIARVLKVPTDYLLGISNVKKNNNDEINKRFKLNENAIDNLDICFNKESLNIMFDNDIDSINFLLEKIEEYKSAYNRYDKCKVENQKQKAILFEKNNMTMSKLLMQQAFLDLIDEHIQNNGGKIWM